jgi:dolichyl-phosphate-mannose-protein mannosyltransferase
MLSALTVLIVYGVMWEAGCGVPACLVAAGLMLFDNAHIARNRLIHLDSIVCFTIASSIFCYAKFSKSKDHPFSSEWWGWLFLTGIALSCTISTKSVGLFTYLTVGTYVITDLAGLFYVGSGGAVSLQKFFQHLTARFLTLIVVPFAFYLLWLSKSSMLGR